MFVKTTVFLVYRFFNMLMNKLYHLFMVGFLLQSQTNLSGRTTLFLYAHFQFTLYP